MGSNKLNVCSADGDVFAHYTPTGILKIWNTDTGSLEQSFAPGDHISSSVTCLGFNLKNERKSKKIKSPGNKSASELCELQFLAIGMVDGKIIIYCATERKFHSDLVHSSSAINDLTWTSSTSLVSLSNDKIVVFWNVLKSVKLRTVDVAANNSICFLGQHRFIVADVNIQIIKVNTVKKVNTGKNVNDIKEQQTFNSGQVIPISIILPVKVKDQDSKYFLTASKDNKHKHVYAWSTESESGKFIAAFKVQKSTVETMSCVVEGSSSLILAVVTSKGNLQIFKHHLNGNIESSSAERPISSFGKLSIVSTLENTNLPIVACQFLSDSTLLFAYGPEFHPTWEKILVDKIEGSTRLLRTDLRETKASKSSLIKTITPLIPDDAATIVTNSSLDYRKVNPNEIFEKISEKNPKRERDSSQILPLEKYLDALAIKQPSVKTSRAPLADGVHLLIQGLLSKDNEMILSILSKGEDDAALNNTVRRLPVAFLDSFLQYLQDLMGKGGKSFYCLKWMKSLLHHHMSHLSNISNREMLMSPIIQWTNARMTIFPKVAKLHSRLSLLLTHVSARHENSTRVEAEPDALLAYKDESDVESEKEFGSDTRQPSESEDFWDDLVSSEDDENLPNGDISGDDGSQETPKNKKSVKRKSSKLENDNEQDEDMFDDDDDDGDSVEPVIVVKKKSGKVKKSKSPR